MKLRHILSMAALLALPAVAQETSTNYFMQSSVNRHDINPALLDNHT